MIAPGEAWAADRGGGGGRGQRKVRAELGEPGVQGDQAAVDEAEHGQRGERLRGAADLEQRMAADLQRRPSVGDAQADGQRRLPALVDPDHHPGHA